MVRKKNGSNILGRQFDGQEHSRREMSRSTLNDPLIRRLPSHPTSSIKHLGLIKEGYLSLILVNPKNPNWHKRGHRRREADSRVRRCHCVRDAKLIASKNFLHFSLSFSFSSFSVSKDFGWPGVTLQLLGKASHARWLTQWHGQ